MSHAPPGGCDRVTPRWSVGALQKESGTASMAGLPGSSACVAVGPPLFWSGPRFGGVLGRSPAPVRLQVPSPSRLWPRDVNVAGKRLQSSPLFATIVFLIVAGPKLK